MQIYTKRQIATYYFMTNRREYENHFMTNNKTSNTIFILLDTLSFML